MIRSIRSLGSQRVVTGLVAGLLALSGVFVSAGTASADTSSGSLLPAVSSVSGSAFS
jgi:hypothetical protein